MSESGPTSSLEVRDIISVASHESPLAEKSAESALSFVIDSEASLSVQSTRQSRSVRVHPIMPTTPSDAVSRTAVLDTVDTTGDGLVDSVLLDTTGDGHVNAVRKIEFRYARPQDRVDARRGSKEEQAQRLRRQLSQGEAAVDVTGDGIVDAVVLDVNGDGMADTLRPLKFGIGANVRGSL